MEKIFSQNGESSERRDHLVRQTGELSTCYLLPSQKLALPTIPKDGHTGKYQVSQWLDSFFKVLNQAFTRALTILLFQTCVRYDSQECVCIESLYPQQFKCLS